MLKDVFLPQESHLSFFPDEYSKQAQIFYMMNKNAIKVIKRDKTAGTQKIKIDFNIVNIKRKTQINLINAVNDWISERRTNSRIEKVFSDSKISEWKISS